MTEIEREILRRFFPEQLLDALDSRWGSAFWYGEPEGSVAHTSSLVWAKPIPANARLWNFSRGDTEFFIYIWFWIGLTWVRNIEFHGPWDQRFQGLITLVGARDVLEARRDTTSGRYCVHAHT